MNLYESIKSGSIIKETEEVSFEEIIRDMENAESYDDLYDAADKIVDIELRSKVKDQIKTCEYDKDPVDVAYSVVTSDCLDMKVNDINETEKLVESTKKVVKTGKRNDEDVALINWEGNYQPFVVAINYNKDTGSWGYGYYYSDEETANKAFEFVCNGGNMHDFKLDDEVTEESEKCNDSEDNLKESYSDKLGGDPEDFISDLEDIKAHLYEIDTNKFGSKLAVQMIDDFIYKCEDQIKMTKEKFGLDHRLDTESEPIANNSQEKAIDMAPNKNESEDDEIDVYHPDWSDPVEALWGACCSNYPEYVKKAYDEKLVKPNTRYERFGHTNSFIMGALRNKHYDLVDLLKSYGETIKKDEVQEYKNIMAAKNYEDDITKSASDN